MKLTPNKAHCITWQGLYCQVRFGTIFDNRPQWNHQYAIGIKLDLDNETFHIEIFPANRKKYFEIACKEFQKQSPLEIWTFERGGKPECIYRYTPPSKNISRKQSICLSANAYQPFVEPKTVIAT